MQRYHYPPKLLIAQALFHRKYPEALPFSLTSPPPDTKIDMLYITNPDPCTGISGERIVNHNMEDYLLVDGYNIIFAWPELKELADVNLDSARTKLQDILCNYQGYKKCQVILVFDGYKVKGNPGEVLQYHNIHVIFTK